MNTKLIKRIAQGLALTGAGATGYHFGRKSQRNNDAEKMMRSQQSSALSSKLREQSDSANRRLKIENYYIRKALNELAKQRLSEKK